MSFRVAPVDESAAAALGNALRLRPLTSRLLASRGLADPDEAGRFLEPRLANLRPPDGMADLDRAVERLATAVGAGERIGVFGDYDVDGVTSAAILASSLRAFARASGGEVVARVASRGAGYGLAPEMAARFADEGCRVVVTGDCGTTDHEALALLRGRGVDAIVIDHHQVPSGETAAYALINPHRGDDRFAFKGLASCGVAFYLAAALRRRLGADFDPRELLDLVALGTIADLVPLRDENRILVAAGLRTLGARKRPGLRALLAVSEVDEGRSIDATTVAFRLAPRLNAAGRLGEAQAALDTLLAADAATADQRARFLDDQNRERQRIQETVLAAALAAAAEDPDAAAIVVGGGGWHHGVVGIVAAKLVDKYRRPALAVAFDGELGRGSARTVPGFDLYRALKACERHLVRCGGHAAAAGLTVTRAAFAGFRTAFLAEAALARVDAGGAPAVDALAALDELDLRGIEELERLGPFGNANGAPVVALRGVVTRSTRVVGADHLQLVLEGPGQALGEAIAFGMAAHDPGRGAALDLVVSPEVDLFRGNRRARLRVRHLFRSEPS